MLAEFVAIPLGSQYVRDNLEPLNKSFLFFGPQGTGKTLAVRAIQTQCSALVLDISPSNILEKYTDRAACKKLFNMAWQVAHEYEPAIILCDELDLVYPKKRKTPQQKAASKMKTPMDKIIQFTKAAKRVIFIGCTNQYEVSPKVMKKKFDKRFYFPYPDYGTRMQLFKHFIQLKGGELKDSFSVSTLAHLTEGYPAGSVRNFIIRIFF